MIFSFLKNVSNTDELKKSQSIQLGVLLVVQARELGN
jgi:hypothetical protein